eukprot:scaffold169875_cov26-Tisochrysis_lutea.AAC.2
MLAAAVESGSRLAYRPIAGGPMAAATSYGSSRCGSVVEEPARARCRSPRPDAPDAVSSALLNSSCAPPGSSNISSRGSVAAVPKKAGSAGASQALCALSSGLAQAA